MHVFSSGGSKKNNFPIFATSWSRCLALSSVTEGENSLLQAVCACGELISLFSFESSLVKLLQKIVCMCVCVFFLGGGLK
jgi:hypothetical protein